MYSRNLGKGSFKVSPIYSALPGYKTVTADERYYRNHLPPGYDGNRFSARLDAEEEMEIKRHTVSPADRSAPISVEETNVEPVEDAPEIPINAEPNRNPATDEDNVEKSPATPDSIGRFIDILKERCSGDDLLLILIILILAADGEEAELAILLLTILLLVK